MKYTVRSDSAQSLNLCEDNRINSILQSLYLLLTTRQGTVPMYRDFGLPMNFIDKPVTVVETLIASEIREAMEKFEKRATFVDVSVEYNENNPGGIIAILEVDI